MQIWRRLPLRPRRGQDRGQDSAHGTFGPRLRANANGHRNGRGGRGEDPEAPPSRALAGPGLRPGVKRPGRERVNRTCWAEDWTSPTVSIVCRVFLIGIVAQRTLVLYPHARRDMWPWVCVHQHGRRSDGDGVGHNYGHRHRAMALSKLSGEEAGIVFVQLCNVRVWLVFYHGVVVVGARAAAARARLFCRETA